MQLRELFGLIVLGLAPVSTATSQAFSDPCLECGVVYASGAGGRFFRIDTTTGDATFVGEHGLGLSMEDIAAASDGLLYGVDDIGVIWAVSACDASAWARLGYVPSQSLMGELDSPDLLACGPPLVRVDASTFRLSIVGGATGPAMPDWCGGTGDDAALNPRDGLLYAALVCPDCPYGKLVQIDPVTAAEVREIGCLVDAATGEPVPPVTGMAFDAECRLWIAGGNIPDLLQVDIRTGTFTRLPITGGYVGAFGLASVPCPGMSCPPLSCEPHSQGFWKRQCARDHPSGEPERLPTYLASVRRTATFGSIDTIEDMCLKLNPSPANDKGAQADSQFMALLLNGCSERLSPECCVSSGWSSASTVRDAVVEIDRLLSDPARTFMGCVRAQGLADDINTGRALCDPAAASAVRRVVSPAIGGRRGPASVPRRLRP